jgi:hypothetical protein
MASLVAHVQVGPHERLVTAGEIAAVNLLGVVVELVAMEMFRAPVEWLGC